MDAHQLPRELSFTVAGHVAKPVEQVYEAVADPEQLSRYFTTGGARGRLEAGDTVTWDFHDFPGAFPVQVLQAEAPRRIVLRWAGEHLVADDGMSRVQFDFEPVDDGARTKVQISESGWQPSEAGFQRAFDNCEGWTSMLAALKAWVEHGINLREGFYK